MGHDVAPVAGRIPYGEKNGFIFCTRFIECLSAPWVPVNVIVGVLEKIWALLINQTVGNISGRIFRAGHK
jgi:hypothetical protein